MNLKIILGIFLPLSLILFLVILSTANIGFSLEKQDVASVKFSSLFVNKANSKNIPIRTITITNDFFLPRKYELPKLRVCLNDKEGIKSPIDVVVKYQEGTYSRESNLPLFDEIFFGYGRHSRQSIELPAGSKKQVKILVEPKIIYNYGTKINSFKYYDELLLIESEDNSGYSYTSCRKLDRKEIDSAAHIRIIK